jgi:hypothetical protein
MTLTLPPWLERHGGKLQRGFREDVWFVEFDHGPQYRLVPAPVGGKYGCSITQTINGKLIPSSGTFPTAAEAIQGGLEDLRKALGW